MSDPVFRGYIETITKKKDVVLILDEVNPADLPPKREFDTETLKNTAWNYREYEAGQVLQQLIKETSTAITPSQWVESVKRVVGNLAEPDVTEIDTQFQGVPVDVSFESIPPKHDLTGKVLYNKLATIRYENKTAVCAVLKRRDGEKELPIGLFETLNTEGVHWIPDAIFPNTGWHAGTQYQKLLNITTFLRLGFGSMNSPEAVTELPRRLTNFIFDLKSFVDSVKTDTPACHADENNKWTYYIKPQLNARRAVFISASGVESIIREMYQPTGIEIETIKGNPPEWEPDNRLFQVSTGRYTPKQSLFTGEDQTRTGIKKRAIELLGIIRTEAEAGKQVLVIAPKDMTEAGSLTEIPELKALWQMPNVQMINHFHAEGVNEYSHFEVAFIFHFEPLPTEIESIARRIFREDALCFDREQTNA